jgi:transcriptional regulator with XRE-family HTH domain
MPRRSSPDITIGENIRMRRQARGWSVRYAADRAGIAHTTWSRIERGLMSADNRFMVADIAAALECAIADITGQPMPPVDRATAEAQAGVRALRQVLVEADLDEEPVVTPRPIVELARETELVVDLRRRCDYAGVGRLLPGLIRDLHAAAHGRDKEAALRLLVEATFTASGTVRCVDSPAESWLAAERCRQAARELGDPVLLALAEYERSHAATGCGSYARGLSLSRHAAEELEPHIAAAGAPEMLGQLHLTVAFAAVGAKQPGEAPDRVSEAGQLAARTGETRTLGLMFGPTNVNFWQVAMEVDAGDPGRAVAIAEQTNPSLVDSPSRQVAFYADTARGLARVRKDTRAVRMLLAAERISAARVHSAPLARETARMLLDRAQRRAGGPELRGLCERMGLPV